MNHNIVPFKSFFLLSEGSAEHPQLHIFRQFLLESFSKLNLTIRILTAEVVGKGNFAKEYFFTIPTILNHQQTEIIRKWLKEEFGDLVHMSHYIEPLTNDNGCIVFWIQRSTKKSKPVKANPEEIRLILDQITLFILEALKEFGKDIKLLRSEAVKSYPEQSVMAGLYSYNFYFSKSLPPTFINLVTFTLETFDSEVRIGYYEDKHMIQVDLI